ncbi:6-bladed beta-propeller [Algoriphagus aquimarinus]|uniref:6-bladed beta-propeller n=1 Tax=Algoriphagus aquimarinus TaxID=237018 RepID=A0A5C7AGB3_9BACT|nr:6-bladed beta-propeller [Algoriphagus aquimarinus]TXE07548.1 6-bladed beta-propeller [Algoriphagus aquimarinus]
MKYNRFCYLLPGLALCCWVFFSCSRSDENALQTILIPKKIDQELQLEQLTKSIKLIQLETNDRSLLSGVLDIKMFNEKIYVSDASRRILIFNQDGKFVKVLGKRGEGPGEYDFFPHMTIDEESNLLYVASARKLYVYSKEDELLLENALSFNVNAFSVLEDKLFVLRQELSIPQEEGFLNRASFYEINKSLDVVDTIPVREVKLKSGSASDFPIKNYFSTVGPDHFVYVPDFGSQILLHDTLYQFKDKILTPFLKMNFETIQTLDKSGIKKIQIHNVINSKSFLFCEYYSDGNYLLFVYEKESAIGYNLQKGVLDGNGNPVVLRPLDLGRDIFYFVHQSEYSDSETEEQNPTIGIVQLK